jgi:hypothetical protein
MRFYCTPAVIDICIATAAVWAPHHFQAEAPQKRSITAHGPVAATVAHIVPATLRSPVRDASFTMWHSVCLFP